MTKRLQNFLVQVIEIIKTIGPSFTMNEVIACRKTVNLVSAGVGIKNNEY